MDLDKKIEKITEQIRSSKAKIELEKKKITEWEEELASLRFSRYTLSLKEFNLSDDEFMAFMKKAREAKKAGCILPPPPEDYAEGTV